MITLDAELMKQSERIINGFSFKVLRRMRSMGCNSYDVEDVRQEMWIAWSNAANRYDPEKNDNFLAYAMISARNQINRWVEQEARQLGIASVSLDDGLDDVRGSFHDVTADPTPDADQQVSAASSYQAVVKRLSPLARRFVELLKDPPKFLVDEFKALAARNEWLRANDVVPPASPTYLRAELILRFLGVSSAERKYVYKEIDQVIQRIA